MVGGGVRVPVTLRISRNGCQPFPVWSPTERGTERVTGSQTGRSPDHPVRGRFPVRKTVGVNPVIPGH